MCDLPRRRVVTGGNGADILARVVEGADPSAALADEVIVELATLDAAGLARAFQAMRDRWPRARMLQDLKRAVKARRRAASRPGGGDVGGGDSSGTDRPEIRADDELHVVVAAAERALAAGEVEIFVRDGGLGLTRILPADAAAPGPVRRDAGAPTLAPTPGAWIRAQLSCVARWYVMREGEEGPTRRYLSAPPLDVVEAFGALGAWPSLRYLAGVVEGPALRPDGSLAVESGYDPATGLLLRYEPASWPGIPVSPTPEDARRAYEALLAPFAQFPFVAGGDRASFAALALTLLARRAIGGPVPGWGLTTPMPGTGKSLLLKAAGLVGTGRLPAISTWPRRGEEAQKTLLAIGAGGDPLAVLDNIEGDFASADLAAALTADVVQGRLLGESRMVSAPWRAVVVATGNNLTIRGDLTRRMVLTRLDAGVEAPDEREGWEHADLLRHVREHRPALATAGLTILRAHAVAGRPRPGGISPPLGSFEEWDRVVRAAVVWVSGADPLARRAEQRAADPEREAHAIMLAAWAALFGARGVLAQEVANEATADAAGYEPEKAAARADLRMALEALCARGEITTRSVAYVLRGLRGRRVDGAVLVSDGKPGTPARWRREDAFGAMRQAEMLP